MPSMLDIYTPLSPTLKQFRLISLQPGQRDGPIECGLRIDSLLREASAYEALSYEWGDPTDPIHEITVQGIPFPVRENLWRALWGLRRKQAQKRPLWLWVDAICINQEDITEKSLQVIMMGEIYERAAGVRVWLGEEEPTMMVGKARGDTAFDLLKKIYDSARGINISRAKWRDRDRSKDVATMRNVVVLGPGRSAPPIQMLDTGFEHQLQEKEWWEAMCSKTDETSWSQLAKILERTYWTRLWIVQEYLLASRLVLHCGLDTIEGHAFTWALGRIYDFKSWQNPQHLRMFPNYVEHINIINLSLGMGISKNRLVGGNWTLLELIEASKKSKCCDPHDKIYGILSLARDVSEGSIVVDYGRSIFKVKMDVVWHYNCHPKSNPEFMSRVCSLLDEVLVEDEE